MILAAGAIEKNVDAEVFFRILYQVLRKCDFVAWNTIVYIFFY